MYYILTLSLSIWSFMSSIPNKTKINSSELIWNDENALWYADQYSNHNKNELTINSITIDPNDILLDIGCE